MKLACALLVTLAVSAGPVGAANSDDIKQKLNDVAAVLEKDATYFETLYRTESLPLIVTYRIGWAWLVDLSDNIYALNVLRAGIGRLDDTVGYISQIEASASAGGPPPDLNLIKLDVIESNDALIGLQNAMLAKPQSCSAEAATLLTTQVPLSTIVSIQAPDFGTFPSLHHDPTLRVKFIITEDGQVSLAPDAYAPGEGVDAHGKQAIPSIASTVSGALVLLAAEKFGAFGGAGTGTAFFAATVVAGLVYFTVSHIQGEVEQGEIAHAVARLNKAIDRIYDAQKVAFTEMNQRYVDVAMGVCKESFTETYRAQLLELDRLSGERQALMAKFVNEVERLESQSQVKEGETWDDVECAIFGCEGNKKGTIVMPLEELVQTYVAGAH
ncbi:hypothetical protein [Rhizobium sp. BT-226]|uniref:hypothetical protein n=1 Tax=Rhizobium sp. BT-226 TaxID=2986922 RepID=UPI0021F6DB35|nr:hypothetical protein [Rhizobium sp. BT-226]MCW0021418.1 hypothetical protein [Rhizobium sp. BT-226]